MIRLQGWVVDASVGSLITPVRISQLDRNNCVLSFEVFEKPGKWCVIPHPRAEKISFVAINFCIKRVGVEELSAKPTNLIKLLPVTPACYLSRIDASAGEHLDLHVHSCYEWGYTLYRHGINRIKVEERKGFEALPQRVPDAPFVATGLDWPIATKIKLREDLPSGLYSVCIEDKEGGRFTTPFVFGPSSSQKTTPETFLVVANTNTWHAYNVWGGKSRYRNFDLDPVSGGISPSDSSIDFLRRLCGGLVRRLHGLCKIVTRDSDISGVRLSLPWMSERLSARRPLPNRWLDEDSPYKAYLDHLAANEWRGLAWLEREGFVYHYCSDERLHRGEINMENYRGVILIGHPEYWTMSMYRRIEVAIKYQGIPLINLSGNAAYHEVMLDAEGSVTPKRRSTMGTVSGGMRLLSVRTDLKVSGFAPYSIEKSAAKHWALEGVIPKCCEQASEHLFGYKSLIDVSLTNGNCYDPNAPGSLRGQTLGSGGSGWEVDTLTEGLPGRSPVLLAKGTNLAGGADMFIIEDCYGLLFSASSISFASTLLVDEAATKICRNVLARTLSSEAAQS